MTLLRVGTLILISMLAARAHGAEPPAHPAPPGQAATPRAHPPGKLITVNGAKLWYESEGEGVSLVLVAGGPGRSHDYFHPWFSQFARSRRVIYFDAFGRGRSDRSKSAKEYTFDRDVEDLERLRQALGLGKIDVLGASYGGMVAQAYALRHPGSVRRLVLVATLFSAEGWQVGNEILNGDIKEQLPEMWEKVLTVRGRGLRGSAPEHQAVYDPPLGLSWFYDRSNEAKLPKEPDAMNSEVYFAIAGDDADFLVGGDVSRLDFRPQLKSLKMPVLITAGRYDRAVPPRLSLQFQDYAPQARFVMFERSGHFIFIEEPGRFWEVVEDFLAR